MFPQRILLREIAHHLGNAQHPTSLQKTEAARRSKAAALSFWDKDFKAKREFLSAIVCRKKLLNFTGTEMESHVKLKLQLKV